MEGQNAGDSPSPELPSNPTALPSSWDEQEFLVKWRHRSYLACEWVPLAALQGLAGFKRVTNYMKKVRLIVSVQGSRASGNCQVVDLLHTTPHLQPTNIARMWPVACARRLPVACTAF